MQVGNIAGMTSTPEARETAQVRKASLEFEGMLLAAFLQSWQQASPFSDEEQSAGDDTLQSVAIQATGNALAKRGLLGIADMVERCLTAHKVIQASVPSKERSPVQRLDPSKVSVLAD